MTISSFFLSSSHLFVLKPQRVLIFKGPSQASHNFNSLNTFFYPTPFYCLKISVFLLSSNADLRRPTISTVCINTSFLSSCPFLFGLRSHCPCYLQMSITGVPQFQYYGSSLPLTSIPLCLFHSQTNLTSGRSASHLPFYLQLSKSP